jgi:GNAT superfamily N-acetyltransferase
MNRTEELLPGGWRLTSDPGALLRGRVERGLSAHNLRRGREISGVDMLAWGRRRLDRAVRDAAGEVAGGIIAGTRWKWLEVATLWLREDIRGRGLGRALLLDAEEAARAAGCDRAILTTLSFQARGFYERLGYQVIGVQKEWLPGVDHFAMVKELS